VRWQAKVVRRRERRQQWNSELVSGNKQSVNGSAPLQSKKLQETVEVGSMRRNTAFTLVEILIVVIILGILAAIVIPQFTEASTDARQSALASDLQTVRSQIELYKVQHLDRTPDLKEDGTADTGNFIARLTGKTDQSGKINTAGALGPYLQKMPSNGFVSANGDLVTFGTTDPAPGSGNGWYWNTGLKKFSANDADTNHTGL
jgi:general secretion pathway protein G